MSLRRRLVTVLGTTVLAVGVGVGLSAPAQAQHACSTDVCYPDLCINVKQKPYSVFC